ncbi:hypothetical protein JCM8547_004152 [Rhodosporidiobolus lusitaniae]
MSVHQDPLPLNLPKEEEQPVIPTTTNILPTSHPVTLKHDPAQHQLLDRTQDVDVEARERFEREGAGASLEKLTTGLGGMVLNAPLAALEKVSPALAHNVESVVENVSHRIQDYTSGGANKEAGVSSAPSGASVEVPMMRPGGEFTASRPDTAYEKTATTASSIGDSLKSTVTSAAETVKANVPGSLPSLSSSSTAAPSTSTTGNSLAQEGSILARSQEARHEASIAVQEAGGPTSSSTTSTSTAPLAEQASSAAQTAQSRLSETAHHAFDLAKSYLPASLGGQPTTATSIPHFTVVSSETETAPASSKDVEAYPSSVEPYPTETHGSRDVPLHKATPASAKDVEAYPSSAEPYPTETGGTRDVPLHSTGVSSGPSHSTATEVAPAGAAGVAQAALDKVRDLGNAAAQYLPSAEKQHETANQASSTLSSTRDTVASTATSTRESVEPYAQSAVEQVQHGASAVAGSVGTAAQAVREKLPAVPSVGGTAAAPREGADTLHEIATHVSPSSASAYSPSAGVDSSSTTTESASQPSTLNPAPQMVGVFPPSSSASASAPVEKAKETVSAAAAAIQSTAQEAASAAGDVARSAYQSTAATIDAGKEKVSETASSVTGAGKKEEEKKPDLSRLRGDSAYSTSDAGTATILGHETLSSKTGGFAEAAIPEEGEQKAITETGDASTRGKEEERSRDLSGQMREHHEPAVVGQAATHEPYTQPASYIPAYTSSSSSSGAAGGTNPALSALGVGHHHEQHDRQDIQPQEYKPQQDVPAGNEHQQEGQERKITAATGESVFEPPAKGEFAEEFSTGYNTSTFVRPQDLTSSSSTGVDPTSSQNENAAARSTGGAFDPETGKLSHAQYSKAEGHSFAPQGEQRSELTNLPSPLEHIGKTRSREGTDGHSTHPQAHSHVQSHSPDPFSDTHRVETPPQSAGGKRGEGEYHQEGKEEHVTLVDKVKGKLHLGAVKH